MKKDPEIFLRHILESINNIESFTKNKTKKDFKKDQLLNSAAIRQIEIIGEAAKNVPKYFKLKHPEIEWVEIAGARDKMIHYYFGLDLDLVWNDILKSDVPKLKKQITQIIEPLGKK